MNAENTPLQGLKIFTPNVFYDHRGYFFEHYKESCYNTLPMKQDNVSFSKLGTIRGLHYQLECPQGKLVSVAKGMIQDVAVDIRKSSPTFGKHFSIILSDANHKQLYIPPGFAHGFLALQEENVVTYKCTSEYHRESERTILWNDPEINILWAGHIHDHLVSSKDEQGVLLKDADLFD
jgi:dTDP-4-dehydrorhamnose 3,5-epimerase